MITETDQKLLRQKGITVAQLETQLALFRSGFPALRIEAAAAVGQGILKPDTDAEKHYLKAWESYLTEQGVITKFVPASGAASRMFKDLFEYLETPEVDETPFVRQFITHIKAFAFYTQLDAACQRNEGASIAALIERGNSKAVVANLLLPKGLNYGALPKGLLQFHSYAEGVRTAALEHLVEGALYAKNSAGTVNIHFTISDEHRSLFEAHIAEMVPHLEKRYGITYRVGFSVQKASTDTVAANELNAPFREEDGSLIFRPGGHGALIENLNDLQSDIIFVKNIDNVVPDHLKAPTVHYKKLLAGILVSLQQQTFAHLKTLENSQISDAQLFAIRQFCETQLNNHYNDNGTYSKAEWVNYLRSKLNRPIRVCGMVKNEGEPGGGPFLAYNADGSVSPQILESSQIADKKWMANATHFNPVDLVCAVRNYRGEKFDLPNFVDKQTGFISEKSKNGKALKALELPGLWNGAMSDWNTVFVEVPVITFNPVKTVNDLLRKEHQ